MGGGVELRILENMAALEEHGRGGCYFARLHPIFGDPARSSVNPDTFETITLNHPCKQKAFVFGFEPLLVKEFFESFGDDYHMKLYEDAKAAGTIAVEPSLPIP